MCHPPAVNLPGTGFLHAPATFTGKQRVAIHEEEELTTPWGAGGDEACCRD